MAEFEACYTANKITKLRAAVNYMDSIYELKLAIQGNAKYEYLAKEFFSKASFPWKPNDSDLVNLKNWIQETGALDDLVMPNESSQFQLNPFGDYFKCLRSNTNPDIKMKANNNLAQGWPSLVFTMSDYAQEDKSKWTSMHWFVLKVDLLIYLTYPNGKIDVLNY
ncbi:MAG: hypothetical protein EP332_13160 [Bacteroidetes bacterium]|nr:MAG: hypothetical protein EP332_13160 [Bacteroidota bacterium]